MHIPSGVEINYQKMTLYLPKLLHVGVNVYKYLCNKDPSSCGVFHKTTPDLLAEVLVYIQHIYCLLNIWCIYTTSQEEFEKQKFDKNYACRCFGEWLL